MYCAILLKLKKNKSLSENVTKLYELFSIQCHLTLINISSLTKYDGENWPWKRTYMYEFKQSLFGSQAAAFYRQFCLYFCCIIHKYPSDISFNSHQNLLEARCYLLFRPVFTPCEIIHVIDCCCAAQLLTSSTCITAATNQYSSNS